MTGASVNWLVIGVGAALGAWLRWLLGLGLNALWPAMPLGTLAANWLGGLLMGATLALIAAMPELPVPLKLMLTTGFLGGLTTFSTFSAEGLHLVQRGEWSLLAIHTVLHVVGALLAAGLGFALVQGWRGD